MKQTDKPSAVVVVGSVALDTVESSAGKVADVLGGSATYFTLTARLFTSVQLVGVVGEDFPQDYMSLLASGRTDVAGLVREKGKTFRWSGVYAHVNEAQTRDTQLNVFAGFQPDLPTAYRDSRFVFLANIHPALQERVLRQIREDALVACDTMNHWVHSHREDLVRLYKEMDIVFVNEGEARMLCGEENLARAARMIHAFGPQWVIIKKGEHGVLAFDGENFYCLPAYPVESVIDPTGAGDTFAGGFMGYLSGQDDIEARTVLKALAYGTVSASFAVEDFSVRRLIPLTRSQIDERLEEFTKMFGMTK